MDQAPAFNHIWDDSSSTPARNQRVTERRPVALPARLTWKDQHGTTRFASVVTRDVSEIGVFVECQSAVSIPLFRLVQFQLEREIRKSDVLPETLRTGQVLSAVYRVSPANKSGKPQGLALRLMVDPKRAAATGPRVFSNTVQDRAS